MKRWREQIIVGIAAVFVVYLYVGGYLSQQREPASFFATYDASPDERLAEVLENGALNYCNDCYCADSILDYIWVGFGYGYGATTGYGYGRGVRYPGYGYDQHGTYRWRGYGYAFNLGNYGYGYGRAFNHYDAYGYSRFARSYDSYGYGYARHRSYDAYGYERNRLSNPYGYRRNYLQYDAYGYRSRFNAYGYGYAQIDVRRNIRELELILKNLDCNDRSLVRKQRELVQMLKDYAGIGSGYGYSHSRGRGGYDHRTH